MPTPPSEPIDPDLQILADECAAEARTFLHCVRRVCEGNQPETAIPLLLLAVSQVLNTGAKLGAITDVVPSRKFEPDLGSDEDVEAIRDALAALLTGLDEYAQIADPITGQEVVPGQISADIAEIASALMHGLRHHAEGEYSEALWWWQFSYLSSWGADAAGAVRALHSIISHIRLDADEDVVSEAEFNALHS